VGVNRDQGVDESAPTRAGAPPGWVNAPARWVDTHVHLDAAEFDPDRTAVVARAQSAGVTMMVLPAVAAHNFDTVRQLAHTHGLAYALGIHPMAVKDASDADLHTLQAALQQHRHDPRLVAVGEIGMDGFVAADQTTDAQAKQQRFYRAQLKLAQQHGLPVVLHVRQAVDAVLAGLRRTEVPGGIAHAYNGSLAQAAVFTRLGLRLGFGGVLTHERALHVRELARRVPAHAIVMETDAPDIPPQWLYQTKAKRDAGATMRNEPCEVPRIAAVLAQMRHTTPNELAALTTHNACAALPRLSALLLQPALAHTRSGQADA
jgi:TatD DNase family protein